MSSIELFVRHPDTVVIDEPHAVEGYLSAHIGITCSEIYEALDYGAAEAATVTAHAALSSFGTRLWDGVLTHARDLWVAGRGWEVARPGGLEVVRRADNRVQITPSMGNEGTGVRDGAPSCKHDRGESTSNAVGNNQLSLGDLAPADNAWGPIQTWWLLYYAFPRDREQWMRAELSLPTEVVHGRITHWSHRLLFGERPFGTAAVANIPEPAPEPEVQLRRRSSS
jgi:hypothetical protein